MEAFSGLRRLFTDKPGGFAPIDDKFVRPDVEGTAKSLRLEQRGIEQAELELPRSDSTELDVIENEIVADVGRHLDNAHIDACNHVRSYETRLSDLELLHGLGEIAGETRKTLGDIQAMVDGERDQLSSLRDAVKLSTHELREFQKTNGLMRPYRAADSTWANLFFILLAGIAETLGNTVFLSENNEFGVMGGIASAALISLINVALGTLAGIFVWRRTNLPGKIASGFAWFVGLIWLAITIAWNLAAGHFRDAQSEGLSDPTIVAIERLSASPFGFEGFYSWAMLLIGMLAAALAAHFGYNMDDEFPRYGRLGREHDGREKVYSTRVAAARGRLGDERDRAIDVAQEVKEQLAIQYRERGRIIAAHGQLLRRFAEHRNLLEELTNQLLKIYRDANRKARQTPPPARFDEPFIIRDPELPDLIELSIDERQVEEAERALLKAISDVGVAFDDGLAKFVPLDDLKKGLENGTL